MRRQSVLALLLAGLTLTAGCSFLAPNPDSYTSTYEYSVGVDATGTLEDVTIRVPLPRDGDAAFDADAIVANETVEGFETRIVDTEYGPALELTAEEFVVEPRYYRFVEEEGVGRREEISESEYDPSNPNHQQVTQRTVSVFVTQSAPYPIETRTPVGESPTFYPSATRELTDCPFPYEGETACFAYDAPVYLSYESADSTRVTGLVAIYGSNEWFAGGWTGNGYADRVAFAAAGPRDGWVVGNGTTEVGRGNYPSPER